MVAGSGTGTFADTAASDDVAESIAEVVSAGGPPGNRFSELEQRWTIELPVGSHVELHVEAWQTTSPDGDQFALEYSTDGVVVWLPIVQQTWPAGDPDADGVWLLPPSLAGTVIVRVRDTDRTAGHQVLDTLWIDELFVRTVTP